MAISMRSKVFRMVLAAGVVSTGLSVAPSQAGPVDGWVVIDSGQIAGTTSDVTELVYAVIDIAEKEGRGRVCTPETRRIVPGDLSWRLWQNEATGAIAFEWIGPGSATVFDDCAGRLEVTVQVTDYAAGGRPPVASGHAGAASDSTASDGTYDAFAQSINWVVYYDPLAFYVRGNSTVEIKVSAQYYNKKAKATMLLGCRTTHTSITPWPTGPTGTTGPAEDCRV